ncbi:MAG: replicative DNA helicase [Geminicoccaceae bacterium]
MMEHIVKQPANDTAEQCLLGAMMFDARVVRMAADALTPDAFFFAGHPEIFTACVELDRQGIKADPVTVRNYFANDQLKSIGGSEYIADLAASVISVSSAPDYARIIADNHLRRQMMTLCDDVKAKASIPSLDDPPEDLLEEAEREFRALTTGSATATPNVMIGEAVEASLAHTANAMQTDGLIGVTTGLRCLDRHLGGLQAGELVVIAARPSIGKTALGTSNFALAAARNNVPVVVFSLEMTADQIAARQMASMAGISTDRQRRGELAGREFVDLTEAGNIISRLPISIDDKPSVSVAYVRQRSRRLRATKKIGLVVIDYLQLMREPGRVENRRLEIGQITGGLKGIAKELQVPVVLLSQLSRQLESRDDKRPILSDLRESGDIEQDADVVIFLYRHGYYLDRCQPAESSPKFQEWKAQRTEAGNKAEFIIAKNRMGPVGRVFGHFDGVRSLFTDQWEGEHG